MKVVVQVLASVLFLSLLVSCRKSRSDSALPPEEQQRINERKEMLLPNEWLESEGLRFQLTNPTGTAQIGLKLFEVSTTRSEIQLNVVEPFKIYAVASNSLANNAEYILAVDYQSVAQGASFDLDVIGFTSMTGSKEFTVGDNSFVPADAGTTKDLLKIRKGVEKFSFYKL